MNMDMDTVWGLRIELGGGLGGEGEGENRTSVIA